MGAVGISNCHRTDIGQRRQNNEDSYAVAPAGAPVWWGFVCDGMGGAAAGEVASSTAVEILSKDFASLGPEDLTPMRIEPMIRRANDRILAAAATGGRAGMGTTLAGLLIDTATGRGLVVHAGDSRVHRLREGVLDLLTIDHNWGEELRRAGVPLPEEGRLARESAALTRVLGMEDFPGPDFAPLEILPGDRYLLASDGLTNFHTQEELASLLGADPFEEAAERLVESTLERGAPDNVTVITAAASPA